MRRRLVAASKRTSEAIAARDRLILEAHEAGGSLREISQLVGVSHVTVKSIIDRSRA